jgi:hypothetical protein
MFITLLIVTIFPGHPYLLIGDPDNRCCTGCINNYPFQTTGVYIVLFPAAAEKKTQAYSK